jgi:type IX secretion system PorP/SprF family membrane protein
VITVNKILKFKVYFLLLLLTINNNNKIQGQDAEFTQFYANPIYLNPAFAGTHLAPRATLNYRNQWPGIPGTFVTSCFSYDQQVESLHGGVGIMFMNDQMASSLQNNRISASYAYQIKLSRNFSIRAGFEGAFWQKQLNYNELTFGDMIDPIRGFVYQTGDVFTDEGTRNGLDFSSGLLGFSEKFYVGFAAHHLAEPNESLIANSKSLLKRKYTAHLGFHLPLKGNGSVVKNDITTLSPAVLFRRQGDQQQINLGMYLQKGPYVLGTWYRYNDSFILLFGYELGLIKVGYSYDLTVSSLSMATSGSHEISMQINFQTKTKKKTSTISCPSF